MRLQEFSQKIFFKFAFHAESDRAGLDAGPSECHIRVELNLDCIVICVAGEARPEGE